MLWLGIDYETTGLDPEKDRIVEVGAVVWDWETKQPVDIYNALVKSDVPLSAEAAAVNGLNDDLLKIHGIDPDDAHDFVSHLAEKCTHCIAHNAPFDKGMNDAYWARRAERDHVEFTPAAPWLDSAVDVPYPLTIQSRKLIMLAAEHGFLNPYPHRAVTDVLTMFKVLSHYDPHEIIRMHAAPTVTLRAMVLKPWTDEGKSTGAAKSIGYRWDQANKIWKKNIKDFQAEDEIKLAKEKGFEAILLKGEKNENNKQESFGRDAQE